MIPDFIIIVPYRDREIDKHIYLNYMKYILEDESNYEMFFIQQDNELPFNRGAIKNLGFLTIKQNYPDDYKNITIVFQDVDTIPYKKNMFTFTTPKGTVKHFYGFDFALGGIFSICAGDFENIHGFPNYWSWGFEDTTMNKRCINNHIPIDRTTFYPANSKEFIQISVLSQPNINLKNAEKTARNMGDSLHDVIDIVVNKTEVNEQPIKHTIYYIDFNTTNNYNKASETPTNMTARKFIFDRTNQINVPSRKKLFTSISSK